MSQALFGIVDNFSDQVKKLFNPSKIQTGNFIFALHQQWTFVIIIVGLIFSSANNYLNTDAIVCYGEGNDTPYIRDFCFLHGGGQVAKEIQDKISSNTQCASMVSEADKDKGPLPSPPLPSSPSCRGSFGRTFWRGRLWRSWWRTWTSMGRRRPKGSTKW